MVPPDWEDCLLYKRTHKSKQGDLLGITVFFWTKSTLKGGEKNLLFKMLVIKRYLPLTS